jgi:outer membrane protein TolC
VGEGNFWDVTLSFEVPLFFWQKQKGEVAEASANSEAAAAELKYTELSVDLEVESSFSNAVSYKNQIELFEKEVLKEADEVYSMAIISYQEGKIGSIGLIDARRTLIDLKQSYLETLMQYRLAMAELEKLVGRSLEGGKN